MRISSLHLGESPLLLGELDNLFVYRQPLLLPYLVHVGPRLLQGAEFN